MAESNEFTPKSEVAKGRVVDLAKLTAKTTPVISSLADEVFLGDLKVRSRFVPRAAYYNSLIDPPPGWREFVESLPAAERSQVIRGIGELIKRGCDFISDVRECEIEQVVGKGPGSTRSIKFDRAVFLKNTFGVRASE